MKWLNQKREQFSRTQTGIKGKKNGNEFRISDYTSNDFKYTHLGWYICVENKKDDKIFNSLWKNIWFEDIENAKVWCEEFNWNMIAKNVKEDV